MSKDSSAKYYQKNKERLQKKLLKGIKIFLKKRKTKMNKMVPKNGTKQQRLAEFRKNHYKIQKKSCFTNNDGLMFLVSTFISLLETLLGFPDTKNSAAIF